MIVLNTIIFYNNLNEIKDYCESLYLLPDTDSVYVVIVTNKIDQKDIEPLKDFASRYSRISILFQDENLGYMNGMIAGYEYFVSSTSINPDYVIMSNTDIIYNDKAFFSKLISKKYDDNIWVIGPSVYANNRHSYDNPVSYERRSINSVKKIIRFTSFPIIRVLYVFLSDYKARLQKNGERPSSIVYEVHGCFFIVKNDLAKQFVNHKYGMLLYSEEAYVAEETFKSGKLSYYDSDLKIIHNEHSVTKHVGYRKIAKYVSSSMKYILNTYYEK